MSTVTLYALGSVIIVSLMSLVGVFMLSLSTRLLNKSIFVLVSLAVGALFGDALIHLIPEAYSSFDSVSTASLFVLLGIFSFFVLEKFLRWRHVHSAEDLNDSDINESTATKQNTIKPVGFLVLVSDGIHNFLDGIIIGASYFVSIEVGIATTIAIIMHEIPQEIGDFGLLIHAGFTKARAILVNFLSALTAVLGVIVALLLSGSSINFVPAATAFAAGSFLYIAGSDLVPELHRVSSAKQSLLQLLAIAIGVLMMWLLLFI